MRPAFRRRYFGFFRGRNAAVEEVPGDVKLIDFAAVGTFSRTTAASVFNPATGVLTSYAANVLRPGNTLAYTLEGAGTNRLVAASRTDIDNAAWTKTNVTVVNGETLGPDGSAADGIDWVGPGTGVVQASQTWASTPSVPFTCSAFVKKRTQTIGIGIASAFTYAPIVPPDMWTRISGTYTEGASPPASRTLALRGDNGIGGVYDYSDGYFWGMQVEDSAFATSYMIDVSGTRAVDELSIASTTVSAALSGKRFYINARPLQGSSGGTTMTLMFNPTYAFHLTSTGAQLQTAAGGFTSLAFAYLAGDLIRLELDPANGEIAAYVNGVFKARAWQTGTAVLSTSSVTYFGRNSGGTARFFGELSDIYEVPVANGDPLLNYSEAAFTRASSAWVTDLRAGVTPKFYTYSSGAARVLDDGAVYIEPARTNAAPASPPDAARITSATDNGTSTDVPVPGMPASRSVTFTSGTSRVQWNIGTLAVSTKMRFGVWLKSQNPGLHENVRLRYQRSDASYDTDVVITTTDTWTYYVAPNTWLNSASGTGNNILSVYSNAGAGVNGNPFLVGLTDIETGVDFLSQSIVTTGAAATRALDNLSFTTFPYRMKAGVWEFDWWPGYSSADSYTYGHLIFGDTNNFITSYAGGWIRVVAAGVQVINRQLSYSARQKITIRVDFVAFTITVSGATTGDGTQAFSVNNNWAALASGLQIGGVGSSNVSLAAISRPRRVI